MSVELGSAYLTILPEMRGFGRALSRGVTSASGAAARAGREVGDDVTREVDNSIDRAQRGWGRRFATGFRTAGRSARAAGRDIGRNVTTEVDGTITRSSRSWSTAFRQGFRGASRAGVAALSGFGRAASATIDRGLSTVWRGAVNGARAAGNRVSSAFSSGLNAIRNQAKYLGIALGAVVASAGAVGVRTAAQLEQSEISFTTMLGSATKAKTLLKDLSDFAQKTPFDLPGLQTAASSLLSVGVDAKKIIPIMTNLGNATAGMGTGAEGVQRATVAIQQMTAAGKISGEDLNQLRDAGVPVFDILTAATGKTTAAIAEMAQKGKLGKKELDALMSGLEKGQGFDKFNGLMDKQSETLAGKWSSIKDQFSQGMAQIVQPAMPALKKGLDVLSASFTKALPGLKETLGGLFADIGPALEALGPKIGPFLDKVTAALPGIVDGAKDFVKGMQDMKPAADAVAGVIGKVVAVLKDVLGFLSDNSGVIAKLIPYLAGFAAGFWAVEKAVAGYRRAQVLTTAVVNAAKAAWAGAKVAANALRLENLKATAQSVRARTAILLQTAAEKARTVATKLAAGAQRVLNAVMRANPIGLVITALLLLGAGLVLLYKKNETFRKIVQKVWAAVKSAMSSVVNWFRRTAWPWMRNVFNSLVGALRKFGGFYVAYLKLVWKGVTKVFGWIRGGFSSLGKAASAAKDAVVSKWSGLTNALKGPLSSALNFLQTKFINPMNSLLGKVGVSFRIPTLPTFSSKKTPPSNRQMGGVPKYKDGGVIRGPWKGPHADNVLGVDARGVPTARVNPNEFITRVSSTKAMQRNHPGALEYINQFGRLPGLAGGGMVYQQMEAWLRKNIPGTQITSDYRPNARTVSGNQSYHSSGKAVDMAPSMSLFEKIRSAFGSNIAELIYSPAGNRQIKNGKPYTYSGAVKAMHYNHVHWAMQAMTGGGGILGKGIEWLTKQANALLGKIPGGGLIGSLGKGAAGKALAGVLAKAKEALSFSFNAGDEAAGAGAGVSRWSSVARQALKLAGVDSSVLPLLLHRMQVESGGNPRAVNNWDSNAKRGTPSKGLMQVIGPTFAANAGSLKGRGIFDPLANIYAAIRYTQRRYGNFNRWAGTKGYAGGGMVTPTLFDTGGILTPGTHLVSNQTGKNETIRTHEQERDLQARLGDGTTINIHGVRYDSAGEVASQLSFAMARQQNRRRYA